MTRVGFIGAGRMGLHMVRRLIDAGHEVRAIGRSETSRTAIEKSGAQALSEITEVGKGADIVIVCVYTDEQVREVCLDSPLLVGMPRGSALIIHTTGSPHTAETIAARSASRTIDVLDAPVCGGPHDIAAGSLTLFMGGADDAAARVRPVLQSYGDPVLHLGPTGAGQRVKLVSNALFGAQIGLLAQAVDLASQLGIDEATLLKALPHGSAACHVMGNIAARGSVTAFTSAVSDFLDKDVAVVRDVVAELGGDLGILQIAIDARYAAGRAS